MRVAINGLFLREPNTGTGQYLRHLLDEFAREESTDEFVVIVPREVKFDLPRVKFVSVNDRRGTLGKNLAKPWFEQILFPRACAQLKVDLAHVPHWGSPLRPPVPTVVTIHDIIPLLLPLYRGSLFVRAYTRLVTESARRAQMISADSECSARDISTYLRIPRVRVQVIYLAADSACTPRSADECNDIRAKFSLPENFVLYLGGFDVRKNLCVLMNAFAQIRDLGVTLVCAGALPPRDSEFFPDPRRLARAVGLSDGEVKFIGRVEEADKPALYSAARAFVFPSRYEGFGLTPLEAMACGAPTLAANAGSLPEVVGEAGIVLDPDDARAWANALREVLTDAKRRELTRALGHAQAKNFSWAKTARETRVLYENVKRKVP